MPGENVENDRGCWGTFGQGFSTGSIHCIQPIYWDHAQDLNHLPVAVRHLAKLALHTPDRWRQVPILEGSAIPEGPGLAGQHRNIMQRVVDGLVAPEGSGVLPHDLAVLPELDALGIGADFYRPTDGATIHGVAVLVEADEAGLRDRRRHGMEAVERADVGHQAPAGGTPRRPSVDPDDAQRGPDGGRSAAGRNPAARLRRD